MTRWACRSWRSTRCRAVSRRRSELRSHVRVETDRGGAAGVLAPEELLDNARTRVEREGEGAGVHRRDLRRQRGGQFVGRPLPVGGSPYVELVVGRPLLVEQGEGQRGGFGRDHGVVQRHTVRRQVGAESSAEEVGGDPGQHRTGHTEPGEPDRCVARTTAGPGAEGVPVPDRTHQIDERLADHRYHPSIHSSAAARAPPDRDPGGRSDPRPHSAAIARR